MKRSLLAVVVVLSVFGLVASASAGQKNRHRDQNNNSNNSNNSSKNFQTYSQNLGSNFQRNGVSNIVSTFKHKSHKHHDNPTPLDPGRGDGRVPVTPVTPPDRPGFVFVDGHWERARAPKTPTMIVDPIPAPTGPVVRDHRTISQPVVRDHRTTTGPFVVRDHRNQNSNGGVSVTTRPNSTRNQNIQTLSGPGPIDMLGNGLSAAGSALGDLFSTEVGDPTPNRDHRTPTTSNFGTNVRDHR